MIAEVDAGKFCPYFDLREVSAMHVTFINHAVKRYTCCPRI